MNSKTNEKLVKNAQKQVYLHLISINLWNRFASEHTHRQYSIASHLYSRRVRPHPEVHALFGTALCHMHELMNCVHEPNSRQALLNAI